VPEEGAASFGEESAPAAVQLHDDSTALRSCPSSGPACFFPSKAGKMLHHHQYQYCCACVYAEKWGEGLTLLSGVFICFTQRREIAERSFFPRARALVAYEKPHLFCSVDLK